MNIELFYYFCVFFKYCLLFFQRVNEHIDLSKGKTGASKNSYGEISY